MYEFFTIPAWGLLILMLISVIMGIVIGVAFKSGNDSKKLSDFEGKLDKALNFISEMAGDVGFEKGYISEFSEQQKSNHREVKDKITLIYDKLMEIAPLILPEMEENPLKFKEGSDAWGEKKPPVKPVNPKEIDYSSCGRDISDAIPPSLPLKETTKIRVWFDDVEIGMAYTDFDNMSCVVNHRQERIPRSTISDLAKSGKGSLKHKVKKVEIVKVE